MGAQADNLPSVILVSLNGDEMTGLLIPILHKTRQLLMEFGGQHTEMGLFVYEGDKDIKRTENLLVTATRASTVRIR